MALFADKSILTLTQPRISLLNLNAELDTYKSLSGYKINASKSEALPINIPDAEVQHLQQCFPYHWKTSALKYLGVQITQSCASLYQANFPPLFRHVRDLYTKMENPSYFPFGQSGICKDDHSPQTFVPVPDTAHSSTLWTTAYAPGRPSAIFLELQETQNTPISTSCVPNRWGAGIP